MILLTHLDPPPYTLSPPHPPGEILWFQTGMLTRPTWHEAKAESEARESEAEAEARYSRNINHYRNKLS